MKQLCYQHVGWFRPQLTPASKLVY